VALGHPLLRFPLGLAQTPIVAAVLLAMTGFASALTDIPLIVQKAPSGARASTAVMASLRSGRRATARAPKTSATPALRREPTGRSVRPCWTSRVTSV
jgi:hypothetical protein